MSEIRTNLLSDAAGTGPAGLFKQSAAKAWANLNGTGTIALRASFNVSSVVDNGVGDYSFSYTNAMANGNYQIAGTIGNTSGSGAQTFYARSDFILVGSFRTQSTTSTSATSTVFDYAWNTPSVHGDLA
jgi:hypothetical protein